MRYRSKLTRCEGGAVKGRAGSVFDELTQLGGPDWFQLGDKDLALHLIRAALLGRRVGASLRSQRYWRVD